MKQAETPHYEAHVTIIQKPGTDEDIYIYILSWSF